MRKIKIITGAAVLAALLVLLSLLIWRYVQPVEAEIIDMAAVTPAPTQSPSIGINGQTPVWTVSPLQTEAPAPSQSPQAEAVSDYFCTLTIKSKEITVLSGVEEEMLKQHPGWLPSSVSPGEDGMCVIYGHRNRKHFRELENVKNGDTITVTMKGGTAYNYAVIDIATYNSTEDLQLPAVDGKALVLVTCYPFRYSGNAPGKYVVTAILTAR